MTEGGLRVSVVIPMLDEAASVERAVASAHAAGADEVLVVDGGSSDGGPERVRPPARLLRAARGRASQLDAGWRAATGGAVVFLHADTILPECAAREVREAIAEGHVGGAFHKRFDSRHPLLRHVRWRTRLWWRAGLAFGDQAIFARRDSLERLGGFRRDVRAEDMDLARRLRRLGPCRLLQAEVITSARRLESAGVLRTWLRWWRIALGQLAREALRPPPRSQGGA